MKMSELQEGARARVVKIDGDMNLKHRIGSLGIFESALVSIVSKNHFGFVVQVFSSKLMVGYEVLDKVIVEEF